MQTVLDEMSGVTIYQNEELHLLGPSSCNISQLGSSNNLKRPIILHNIFGIQVRRSKRSHVMQILFLKLLAT